MATRTAKRVRRNKRYAHNSTSVASLQPSLEAEVRVDASGYGLGACLVHNHEGMRPVAYASRLLNNAERNYSITEKECLEMVLGLERFRHYVEGIHFTVITDHCALC